MKPFVKLNKKNKRERERERENSERKGFKCPGEREGRERERKSEG